MRKQIARGPNLVQGKEYSWNKEQWHRRLEAGAGWGGLQLPWLRVPGGCESGGRGWLGRDLAQGKRTALKGVSEH